MNCLQVSVEFSQISAGEMKMKLEEIKKKFKGEWVIIEYTQLDENLVPLEGEILAHSPLRDVIYKEQLRYKGKQLAIEYLEDIPEDWVVML